MARPRADLGALLVSKATAAQAVPHAPVAPTADARPVVMPQPGGGPPKALTVKLDGPMYWRLQRYCMARGQQEGRRLTHQEVMIEGLRRLLEAESSE